MAKERKKKQELEAWQKKVGALTYLGQTVLDSKGTAARERERVCVCVGRVGSEGGRERAHTHTCTHCLM